MDENIKKQNLITKCSVCRNDLKKQDFFVIKKENIRTLFHVTCPNCQTSLFVSVTADTHGMVGLGAITDLSRNEIVHMIGSAPISFDDVIDAYSALN